MIILYGLFLITVLIINMSGSVHFKFKSAKAFDTVTFDGVYIRLIDLKRDNCGQEAHE